MKLYEYGWEIPCFFLPVGGKSETARILSLMGGGAKVRRNEHFSKPKKGGIQHGGIPH